MNNNTPKTIIIAAGGTGGHIFPGLAVAKHLIAKGHKVVWLGTKSGLERDLIPQNNIPIYYIHINGFRGKNLFIKLLTPFNLILAILQAIKIIRLLAPQVVIGMGGFVSGPAGIAAWLLGIKLIIHEQNAVAGSSNKILAYFADHILESFPNSFPDSFITNNKYLKKIILTGLPVRNELLVTKEILLHKHNNIFNILIIGGSRGAQFLNQTIPTVLAELGNIKILHQTGQKHLLATQAIYAKYLQSNQYEIVPFIENMQEAYLTADLVICRAGAATIFEIMAVGVAAILIPFPSAIDDHQTKNALYLANNQAGILLQQRDITKEVLKNLIVDLQNNRHKLQAIQQAAKLLYKKFADQNSTELISSITQ